MSRLLDRLTIKIYVDQVCSQTLELLKSGRVDTPTHKHTPLRPEIWPLFPEKPSQSHAVSHTDLGTQTRKSIHPETQTVGGVSRNDRGKEESLGQIDLIDWTTVDNTKF